MGLIEKLFKREKNNKNGIKVKSFINWKEYENCPACGSKAIIKTVLWQGESTCSKGHKWHLCGCHNIVVEGAIPDNCDLNKGGSNRNCSCHQLHAPIR